MSRLASALPARQSRRRFLLAVAASGLCACAGPRPMTVPMRSITHRAPRTPGQTVDTLAILLPGVYDTPEDFVNEGFVAAVHERRLAVDLQLVDAHLGYYSDHMLADRLNADFVAPAREAGYRQVWLVGISLGGLGALLHAQEYPMAVDGLFLIAPYLGNRGIQQEIEAHGGLKRWQPAPLSAEDGERRVWHWIATRDSGRSAPQIWLGYGTNDRFAAAHRMLADTLPAERIDALPGGHDWPVWRTLWARFLDRNIMAHSAPLPSSALPPLRPAR